MVLFKRDEWFGLEGPVEPIFSSFALAAGFRPRPQVFDAMAFFCARAALRARVFPAGSVGETLRVLVGFFFSFVFAIVPTVYCMTGKDEVEIYQWRYNICSEHVHIFYSDLLLLSMPASLSPGQLAGSVH